MGLTWHFAHRQWSIAQRYGGQRFAFAHPTWLISNLTVLPEAQVQGGQYSGYIVNQGSLTDIEFVGALIDGGMLAGTISNRSRIGGTLQNVHLAENTVINGGYLAGMVEGDPQAPAWLEHLTVKAGSTLTHVILGNNVVIADGVTLGDGVEFTTPPVTELPEETVTSQLPQFEQVTAINTQGQPIDTLSQFNGGISINGKPFTLSATQHLSDSVEINGEITVDPTHVTQAAKIVVYARYQPLDAPAEQPPLYFMLDEQGTISPWDEDISHLRPYQSVNLEAVQSISLYQGQFIATGMLKLFFGYQLPNGTTVQHVQPIEITIEE